ncbi:DUF1990 family protein, partial [Micromonospora sp. NPDC005220]|uniref:DUF1990 family protein n=1 Tax=Micromonospora sp. NPDC005220 TaxID=3155589 RepID=UPI0033A49B23
HRPLDLPASTTIATIANDVGVSVATVSKVLNRDGTGAVWFEVRAFSLPDRWFTRAGGPAVRAVQHTYAWWLGRTLRRLCAGR